MERQTHLNSPSDQDSFQSALELLFGDGLHGAEKLIERELDINPESWEAIAARADIYYFKERYEDALKCCDRSLSLNPKNALTWITRGDALYKLGRFEEAIECYDRAIEAEPLFAKALYNKRLVLEVQLKNATRTGRPG
jgi:tetratricopeptide (TPR) repeat protein